MIAEGVGGGDDEGGASRSAEAGDGGVEPMDSERPTGSAPESRPAESAPGGDPQVPFGQVAGPVGEG